MIKRIAIVIVGIVVIVLGRGFFLYNGFYTPPPTEMPGYENIALTPAPTAEFSDNASDNISEEEKAVLIDLAHNNNFEVEEINVLLSRLVSRGLSIRFLHAGDDLETELLGEEEEEIDQEEAPPEEEEPVEGTENVTDLEEELLVEEEEKVVEEEEEKEPPPVAFIVISPRGEFSREENKIVEDFLENGGKLLLIADPTRDGDTNSIALKFGLIFEPDYLYNMVENELNYRNIFIAEFEENEVTKDIEKIALYTAGSITSDNLGISFIDENTFSSLIETRRKLSPMALAKEAKVLAIYDLTFITEPYNGTLDNNRLISNIADWLASPAGEGKKERSCQKVCKCQATSTSSRLVSVSSFLSCKSNSR